MTLKRIAGMVAGMMMAGAAFAADNAPPEGFVALFNGTDLSGWWGAGTEDPEKYMSMPADKFAQKRDASLKDIQKHWRVENGELVNDGHGLFLTTDKYYGDFELTLDYNTVAKADSGIYLRGLPQVQIWDWTKEGGKWKFGADKGSGGLWNNGGPKAPGRDPLVKADKPFGEWNHFRIIMIGDKVTVWLNDQLVVDHAPLKNYFGKKTGRGVPEKGPIQLQTHGGAIRWKNVFLREIPADEAKALDAKGGPAK